jgi:hypothetical protein
MVTRLIPVPVAFWNSVTGREPVREFLQDLSKRNGSAQVMTSVAVWLAGWNAAGAQTEQQHLGTADFAAQQAGSAHFLLNGRQNLGTASRFHPEDTENSANGTRPGSAKTEGYTAMKFNKKHLGSSFERWLEEEGILEESTNFAVKNVLAWQLAQEMKKKKLTKQQMAASMKTSRAQLDRVLDPKSGNATLETLQRAAQAVGRKLKVELV